MLVMDNEAHILIAIAMSNKSYFLAVGDHSDAWDFGEAPVYSGEFEAPFAFIREDYKGFVIKDEEGDIEFDGVRYSRTTTPTRSLAVSFRLKGDELEERTMRQQVIVSECVPTEGNENNVFFETDEIDSSNMKKILAENISPLKIEVGSTEVITYIVTF